MAAAITFFAVRDDLAALIEFLLAETGARIFEAYSSFDQPLREFSSVADLERAYALGIDEHGSGSDPFLLLWWPTVCPAPMIERIELRAGAVPGHTFRYSMHGWGLAQLQCGGLHGDIITKSHFGHFTEAGARRKGYDEGGPDAPVDWKALQRLSGRVRQELRGKLAGGVVRGRGPVLRGAAGMVRAGAALKESGKAPWSYEMDRDQIV